MKKLYVAIVGIVSIAIMDCVALMNGINGPIFTSACAAIAGIVTAALGLDAAKLGTLFFGFTRKKVTKLPIVLAAAGATALAGCSSIPSFEICYDHPRLGRICVELDNGRLIFKKDLPPEDLEEARRYVLEEQKKNSNGGAR